MNRVYGAALEIQAFCDARDWAHCIIGGLAVIRWGEPIVRTCSAEDLVVLKAIANRGRDWSDIEGVIVAQRDMLDWPYIGHVLSSLSDVFDAEEAIDRLAEIRRIAEEE